VRRTGGSGALRYDEEKSTLESQDRVKPLAAAMRGKKGASMKYLTIALARVIPASGEEPPSVLPRDGSALTLNMAKSQVILNIHNSAIMLMPHGLVESFYNDGPHSEYTFLTLNGKLKPRITANGR
jgi:hypothetical protein